jgi:hypothetical protein
MSLDRERLALLCGGGDCTEKCMITNEGIRGEILISKCERFSMPAGPIAGTIAAVFS